MVLGMMSEIVEFHEARVKNDGVNISEELADIMWYLANYCNFRNFDLETIVNNRLESESILLVDTQLVCDISILSDYVKKFVAYKKPLDEDLEKIAIFNIYRGIEKLFEEYYGDATLLKQSLELNIAKLKIRYPDKFKESDALNRDLKKERNKLEQFKF